jgi:alpha-glucosidase
MPTAHEDGQRDHWWRDAVIYEIYVRSFSDSDGDGVGDLPGVTARLGALAELGVDAVWLTPFYRSPMADGGYDVADYRDVDPMFGTLADFDTLMQRTRELGLKVIVDIVPNHTSDAHPWFRAALAAPPGSPERARYIFRNGTGPDGAQPPTDWVSNFGGPAWSRVADGQWYLHMFTPEQPDLNWGNPQVHEELASTLRFWLDRGVDGFRIDVAHGLVKDLSEPLRDLGELSVDKAMFRGTMTDHPLWDRDEVHEIYREWRKILDEYTPARIAVAEAWAPRGRLARYVRSDELHQAFNFHFLDTPWSRAAFVDVIDGSLAEAAEVGASSTWVLSNHDVIRHASRYALPAGADPEAWLLSDGAQPRIDAELGLRRARAATLLMLALPGAAYIYQGEELGLHEVADLPPEALADPNWRRSGHRDKGRDGCRVPIPWEPTGPSFGFGSAAPWLPQPRAWAGLARSRQAGDPSSTLELYRRALDLRRRLLRGASDRSVEWLDAGPEVLAFRRDTGLVCVVNFSTQPVALPAGELQLATVDISDGDRLPPDAAAWLLLG